MKIIKQLNEEEFVISLADFDRKKYVGDRIQVAHDYVRFSGTTNLQTDTAHVKLNTRHASCANQILIPVDVTIDIKSMQKVVLPHLSGHKYLQPEHLADRIHTKDDEYWNTIYADGKFTKPRFKKGDKYPAYSYCTQIIYYIDEEKGQMVAISREGEKEYSHVTLGFFNELILPNL